jgi:hypothetical protein
VPAFRSVSGRFGQPFWDLVDEFGLRPVELGDEVTLLGEDWESVSGFCRECSVRFRVPVRVVAFGDGWLVSVPRFVWL